MDARSHASGQPEKRDRERERERERHTPPARSPLPGTVLIVDDDPWIVDLLVMALRDDGGLSVRTACTVAQALATWNPEQEPPALILLDATLPGEEVHDAAARLRSRPGWEHARLVLCSGREDVAALACALGAVDHLRKPFDVDHLIALAQRHAHLRAGESMV
jgi:CheY-like chemotaxis protein